MDSVRSYLHLTIPQLRRVSLEVVPEHLDSYTFDEAPFSHGPPSALQELCLRNVTIPWPKAAVAWPDLLRLEILLSEGVAQECRFSLLALLETLAHFPKLEDLLLIELTLAELRSDDGLDEAQLDPKIPEPANGMNQHQATAKISLPGLRYIQINFRDLYSAVEFARHISAHPSCSISYECDTCQPLDAAAANHPSPVILLQNVLPGGVKPLSFIDELRIHFTVQDASMIFHVTSGQGRYTSDVVEAQSFSLTYHDIPRGSHLDFARIAAQKLNTDITRVQVLFVDFPVWDGATKSLWRDCFSRCAAVEHLEISYEGLFLLSPSHTESGLRPGELAFSQCSQLIITNTDVANDDPPPPPPATHTIIEIINILQLRRNAYGCGLKTLRVSRKVIPREGTMEYWRDLWSDCAEVVTVEDRIA